jgi:protein-disulfide isomerase
VRIGSTKIAPQMIQKSKKEWQFMPLQCLRHPLEERAAMTVKFYHSLFKPGLYSLLLTFGTLVLSDIVQSNQSIKPAPMTENDPYGSVTPLPIVAMGSKSAPLKVVMFHSLNCPHCKEFKTKVLPQFKQKYIDKGLVYLEMRDFPTDPVSLAAAKLAWCKAKTPESYLKYAQIIMNNFKMDNTEKVEIDWANTDDLNVAIENLTNLLSRHNLSPEECKACLKGATPVENAILKTCMTIQKSHHLDYAPGFLINNEILVGLPDIEKQVDKMLKTNKN